MMDALDRAKQLGKARVKMNISQSRLQEDHASEAFDTYYPEWEDISDAYRFMWFWAVKLIDECREKNLPIELKELPQPATPRQSKHTQTTVSMPFILGDRIDIEQELHGHKSPNQTLNMLTLVFLYHYPLKHSFVAVPRQTELPQYAYHSDIEDPDVGDPEIELNDDAVVKPAQPPMVRWEDQ